MKKLKEAVLHYVNLHCTRFAVQKKSELIQIAYADIHGKYAGEILVSNGTTKHSDETPTYIETIQNPGEDYYLWSNQKSCIPLREGRSFYCDTTQLHQLYSRKALLIGDGFIPDEPWIGLSIVGPRPTKKMLNLYKHIIISSYVNGIPLSDKSRYSYSWLDFDAMK